eukprot:1156625-Pelagomonas_calceolata.AAC.10
MWCAAGACWGPSGDEQQAQRVEETIAWIMLDTFWKCGALDGSFVYVPKGVHCPMELSTYFRINASETGQRYSPFLKMLLASLESWSSPHLGLGGLERMPVCSHEVQANADHCRGGSRVSLLGVVNCPARNGIYSSACLHAHAAV